MPIFEYNCRGCDQQFETIVLSTRDKNQLSQMQQQEGRQAIVSL